MARQQKKSSPHSSPDQNDANAVDWQALLDAAMKDGRPLIFPPGRYRLDSTLVFPKSSAGITADGQREAKTALSAECGFATTAARPGGAMFGRLDGRQEDCHEHADDPDHDEQLNEGKTMWAAKGAGWIRAVHQCLLFRDLRYLDLGRNW